MPDLSTLQPRRQDEDRLTQRRDSFIPTGGGPAAPRVQVFADQRDAYRADTSEETRRILGIIPQIGQDVGQLHDDATLAAVPGDQGKAALDAGAGKPADPAMAQSQAYQNTYYGVKAQSAYTAWEADTSNVIQDAIDKGGSPGDVHSLLMDRVAKLRDTALADYPTANARKFIGQSVSDFAAALDVKVAAQFKAKTDDDFNRTNAQNTVASYEPPAASAPVDPGPPSSPSAGPSGSPAAGSAVPVTPAAKGVPALLDAAAAKYGLDPALVRAVAKRESAFRQSARSDKGAIGVMQLMPATAWDLGVDPHDLGQNVDGGVRYLAQLSARYGGDVRKTLAAYNAGMGAVDRHGGVPPYAETQGYVSGIMADLKRAGITAAAGLAPTPVSADAAAPTSPAESAKPYAHIGDQFEAGLANARIAGMNPKIAKAYLLTASVDWATDPQHPKPEALVALADSVQADGKTPSFNPQERKLIQQAQVSATNLRQALERRQHEAAQDALLPQLYDGLTSGKDMTPAVDAAVHAGTLDPAEGLAWRTRFRSEADRAEKGEVNFPAVMGYQLALTEPNADVAGIRGQIVASYNAGELGTGTAADQSYVQLMRAAKERRAQKPSNTPDAAAARSYLTDTLKPERYDLRGLENRNVSQTYHAAQVEWAKRVDAGKDPMEAANAVIDEFGPRIDKASQAPRAPLRLGASSPVAFRPAASTAEVQRRLQQLAAEKVALSAKLNPPK